MNTQNLQLNSPVSVLPFVGPNYQKKLSKIGIENIYDLLHHIPHGYQDFRNTKKIKDLKVGEVVTVIGTISRLKNQPTKSGKLMQIGTLTDETGSISIIWFNQSYLTKVFFEGETVSISGKPTFFGRNLSFFSPQYEKLYNDDGAKSGKIISVYPLTEGLSSKWLKARIKYALSKINIDEFLDKKVLKKYKLIDFNDALIKIHFPKNEEDFEKAKERLSFNEFYDLLKKAKERKEKNKRSKSIKLTINHIAIQSFIESLPFKLTKSQRDVTDEILKDLGKDTSMNRLLQGDVGSGKTVVSLIAAKTVIDAGLKVIILAPTQILAKQHYETAKQILPTLDISIITANSKQLIANSQLIIGTHALLNKRFEKVGLLIVDEGHKFGVKQVNFLQKQNPHKLTMTATPIPRTIAQTLFSDMDLSIINELPKGRKKIKTWLVPNEKRDKAYAWVSSQITSHKSQCYVICPLVEESESETLKDIKSVKKEFLNLKSIFINHKLGLLHGKMKDNEKHKVLDDFKNKKIDILVSTPVVEVGIDIPNATMIIIEAADRFGLASLHQLRGRVGRGDMESYCLLFSESNNEKVTERLEALTKTNSGFDLAEIDFKLRGAGEVLGTKQHGIGELKIADWSQTKIIQTARKILETGS